MNHAVLRLLLLWLMLGASGCAVLPTDVDRRPSMAVPDTGATGIGRMVTPLAARHPGESGAYPLLDPRDAFAARWVLAGKAERSIDVQYYIWHPDVSGSLMAHALREAAQRGVRVRVLLDDANTGGMDADIAAIAAQPNMEVRLFNPFANRSWRPGDYIGDFSRVNRRMHNKSFTADNQVSIVGGRNIGDEYLGARSRLAFDDLDVMAIGPVVDEISASFDAYWNSASAYPAGSLLPAPTALALAQTEDKWARRGARPEAEDYLEAASKLALLQQMRDATLPLAWGPARVLSDDPGKVQQRSAGAEPRLQHDLRTAFGTPGRELLIVSPYFVPGDGSAAILAGIAGRGVRVTVLTNSLAATDVPATYAGYLRYRDMLLHAGVRLYELKPAGRAPAVPGDADDAAERRRGSLHGSAGGSTASLHAKTFVVDRSRVFVGSYNLDPRSARLNTEMGVLMDSPELASRLADAFAGVIARDAYEVQLGADGQVVWIEPTPEGDVRHAVAPASGGLRGLWIGLLRLLPIEWLL